MHSMGYVYSDGFKLQYIVDGEGAPTIIVGSSLTRARTFSKQRKHQAKNGIYRPSWFCSIKLL
jgi:hypothetical protein